ncbi:unnamed protein product [Closterium sp. NIES-54]
MLSVWYRRRCSLLDSLLSRRTPRRTSSCISHRTSRHVVPRGGRGGQSADVLRDGGGGISPRLAKIRRVIRFRGAFNTATSSQTTCGGGEGERGEEREAGKEGGSSTERGGGRYACRFCGGIEGIKSYIWREELPRHHHGCCTCHERAAMSLNAHSLSSLVSDPHSPGVGTAPPVAALPARLDHSHELSAAALRSAAVQAVIRVQGVGTAPPLTAPPAGPQRRALCCCAAAARVALA